MHPLKSSTKCNTQSFVLRWKENDLVRERNIGNHFQLKLRFVSFTRSRPLTWNGCSSAHLKVLLVEFAASTASFHPNPSSSSLVSRSFQSPKFTLPFSNQAAGPCSSPSLSWAATDAVPSCARLGGAGLASQTHGCFPSAWGFGFPPDRNLHCSPVQYRSAFGCTSRWRNTLTDNIQTLL